MSRHRQIKAKEGNNELTVSDHETDTPIIPVAQLEQLHKFRPDRVDWMFDQTEKEADFRRNETRRINNFVFAERLLGTVCGFALGVTGLIGSMWLANQGHDKAAMAIGGVTLASLVSSFLYVNSKKSKAEDN